MSREPDAEAERWLGSAGAAAIGLTLTCAVFYPGVMSPDSIDQYREAVTREYSSTFRLPIMSLVWTATNAVIPGPFGLVLFHQLMFWTGLALVVGSCRFNRFVTPVVVLAVGLCPPVFALHGHLWKDVGFGCALTLFSGLALFGRKRRSIPLLLSAIAPLFYAAAVRFNSGPALLPLVALWWMSVAEVRGRAVPRVRPLVGLTLAGTFALLFASFLVSAAATSPTAPRYPGTVGLQMTMLHDLQGISVRVGHDELPEAFDRNFPRGDLRALTDNYQPANVNVLVWRAPPMLTHDPVEAEQLARAWLQAVKDHPVAWLAHRWAVVKTMFQLEGVYYAFHERIDPNDLGLEFHDTALYSRTIAVLHASEPWLFRGWAWALLACGVVGVSTRNDRSMSALLALSGLFYVVPYAVISTGSDFRYIWWLVIATLLAVIQSASEAAAAN